MKKIALLILMCFLLSACESSYDQVTILLKNNNDKAMQVTLYPKKEFIQGSLYKFSSIGSGYRETTFSIEPGMEQDLYTTDDLDIKPYVLVSLVFDSIHIGLTDLNNPEIKFSSDRVIGYSENLYSENSSWIYEKLDYDEPAMFHRTTIHSSNYTYIISPVEKK
jgi:hypothetical protein